MPPVRLERLVKLAFDQIRQASTTTPAVLIRQLEAIRRLAPRLPDACRQELSEQADAIRESATALVTLDRRDLDAAWHRARAAVDASPRLSSAGSIPA
jgi:DNA-binding GntR family transcriptional regulator